MSPYEYLALPLHQVRPFRVTHTRPWRISGCQWRPEIWELLCPGPWPWTGSEPDARAAAVLTKGTEDYRHMPMVLFRRPTGEGPWSIEARNTSRTHNGAPMYFSVSRNMLRMAA